MTAKNVFVAGTDIVASQVNENFATLPYAMEIKTQNITGTGSIALSVNRFTQTPRVLAGVVSTANTLTSVTLGVPTLSGGIYTVPIYCWTGTSASTVARAVTIYAVQQTSGASDG